MQKKILSVVLFLSQVYLTFWNVMHFGKFFGPIILFLVGVSIAYFWWDKLSSTNIAEQDLKTNNRFGAFVSRSIISMFPLMILSNSIQTIFNEFGSPQQFSDVIPQLQTLYQRFVSGSFPYSNIDVGTHIAYPVYLPMHWLPMGISDDPRWIGFIFLVLSVGIINNSIVDYDKFNFENILILVLPSLVLLSYIYWAPKDISVSFELIIAAYYIILSAGLLQKNIYITALGLILCLLSRYTLVFWIPLFSIILFYEKSIYTNIKLWLSVFLSIILIYIIPFVCKNPSIFIDGINYHNGAALAEWIGYGNPPVSWTMEQGNSFAIHFKSVFSGDIDNKLFYSRCVQGAVMLFLFLSGFYYYKVKNIKEKKYEYLFIMLYLTLLCFYFFGPLTYRYYHITPLLMSSIITGRMILSR